MSANLLLTQHARRTKWIERIKTLVIVLLIASGWPYGMYTDSQVEDREAMAYIDGVQETRKIFQSGGDLLMVSQVCTAWWFGNNPTQQAVTRKQMCGGKL